jgi:LmbE family N-acetylglucosaminyl deacetylase
MVEAAWLTSGGFDGQEDQRELETFSAMDVLGLKREQCHFLRLPDGHLAGHLQEAIEKVAALIVRFKPGVIWVTAFEGGHADHDAANFIAYSAARLADTLPIPSIYEFPCYSPAGTPITRGLLLNSFPPASVEVCFYPIDDNGLRLKTRMLQAYSTQREVFKMLGYPDEQQLRREGEVFRKVPENRNYSCPPVQGLESYAHWFNSRSCDRFSELAAAMSRVRISAEGTERKISPQRRRERGD